MCLCSLTDWLQWAPKNKAFVFHISYRSENFVTESLQWLRRELKEQSADIYIFFPPLSEYLQHQIFLLVKIWKQSKN